jgi:integrase/recombinase XerD
MVKALGQDAGIPRAHPHLFRHSAATWMLQRGMDLVTVAKILGHASLNMINRVYAHIAPADTFAAMVRYLSD